MIRLWTLGGLDLRDADGRELRAILTQPKRLALLSFLALHNPRGFISREHLLALFWPEQDDDHARSALNRALYYLRNSLGAGVVLSRGDDAVSLSWKDFWCDASAFESAASNPDTVRAAVDLYRGDLMHGFHLSEARGFEEWLDTERRRLRLLAHRAGWLLADREEASGDIRSATHWARWANERAPYDEAALQRLIVLLDRVGDRAGAIHAYEDFARRLNADLEVAPAPETRALVEAIRGREHENGPRTISPNVVASKAASGEAAPELVNVETAALAPAPRRSRRLARRAAILVCFAGAMTFLATPTWIGVHPAKVVAVVISPIENQTGDATLDAAARNATDRILRSVEDAIESRTSITYAAENEVVLDGGRKRMRPSVRVTGELYRAPGGLAFHVRLLDEARRTTWTIPPIQATADSTQPAIRELGQRVTGGVAGLLNRGFVQWLPVATAPPTYDAIIEVLRASRVKEWWTTGPYYERAAALDTTFTYALLQAARSQLGTNPVRSHAILRELDRKRERLPLLQIHLLDAMLAEIADDRMATYEAMAGAARLAPARYMGEFAMSAYGLYRPRETLRLLARAEEGQSGLGNWVVRTELHHQLGQHRREIALARRARQQRPNRLDALYVYVRGLAAAGRTDKVMTMLDSALDASRDARYTPGNIMQIAADELRAHGEPEAADSVVRRMVDWYRKSPTIESDTTMHKWNLAHALYQNGEWREASSILEGLVPANEPFRALLYGDLGAIAARSGDRTRALHYLAALDSLHVPAEGPRYEALTSRARINALLGDGEAALRLLRDAVGGQGMDLHADADFESLKSNRAFREFVRPKS